MTGRELKQLTQLRLKEANVLCDKQLYSKWNTAVDKKTLVKALRPVFESLRQTGLVVTDVELLPIHLKGYYTLAVSADWSKSMTTMDKIRAISSKVFELVPAEKRRFIESVFPYESPEELEGDFENFYHYYQSDGLCRELFYVLEAA